MFSLKIKINPPYKKIPERRLNEFLIPAKDIYTMNDLSEILKAKPHTLRDRFRTGFYPEVKRMNGKRVFSLDNLRKIVEVTEKKKF